MRLSPTITGYMRGMLGVRVGALDLPVGWRVLAASMTGTVPNHSRVFLFAHAPGTVADATVRNRVAPGLPGTFIAAMATNLATLSPTVIVKPCASARRS